VDEARFVTVDDYEPVARERLPTDVYDYYAGGAGDEWTLAENRRSFDRWILRPRFLRATGPPDASTELFGTRISAPILVAPWAYQRLAHPEGEVATARGAAREGTIMVVSTTAVDDLEVVAKATDGPKWWQLYIFTDRGKTTETLDRVAAAGYRAVCWTVDFPTNGLRHRDTRNGFVMPMGLEVDELEYDPMISWDDLAYIREHVPGVPVLVKGILTAEDAEMSVQAGVDGIIVSNHGGRQLDSSLAGLDALPEVLEAVGGRVPVLVDGGVRRGTSVMKAIALGAAAVLVGRPAVWGLTVGGEGGVADVLRILREEFENAMALVGCRTAAEIGPEAVAPAP
jgi:4-hydroxymandelate oxidase